MIADTRVPGVYRTADFRAAGWTERRLREGVAAGRLVRVRRGWLAVAQHDPQAVRAVKLGGVLSCVSALAWYGVWVPEDAALHLRCTRRGVALFRERDDVLRCSPRDRSGPAPSAVDPLEVALTVAMRCLSQEWRLVALESILNLGLMTRGQLGAALARCPLRVRKLVDRCLPAESGTETLARRRLRARGVKVRPQVTIEGIGRVDLLIGERLVVECDSRAHHTDLVAYQRDRERDRALVAMGYLVVRLTYSDVVHHWERVEPLLLGIIRSGRHRASRRGVLS